MILGKMIKPDYFIENQYASDNKHDAIKPTMSAKIIRSHVNMGAVSKRVWFT